MRTSKALASLCPALPTSHGPLVEAMPRTQLCGEATRAAWHAVPTRGRAGGVRRFARAPLRDEGVQQADVQQLVAAQRPSAFRRRIGAARHDGAEQRTPLLQQLHARATSRGANAKRLGAASGYN